MQPEQQRVRVRFGDSVQAFQPNSTAADILLAYASQGQPVAAVLRSAGPDPVNYVGNNPVPPGEYEAVAAPADAGSGLCCFVLAVVFGSIYAGWGALPHVWNWALLPLVLLLAAAFVYVTWQSALQQGVFRGWRNFSTGTTIWGRLGNCLAYAALGGGVVFAAVVVGWVGELLAPVVPPKHNSSNSTTAG